MCQSCPGSSERLRRWEQVQGRSSATDRRRASSACHRTSDLLSWSESPCPGCASRTGSNGPTAPPPWHRPRSTSQIAAGHWCSGARRLVGHAVAGREVAGAPLIRQLGPGSNGPAALLASTVEPFISQIAAVPVGTLPQDVGHAVAVEVAGVLDLRQVGPASNEPAGPLAGTVEPFISQIVGRPSSFAAGCRDLAVAIEVAGGLDAPGSPGIERAAGPSDSTVEPFISKIAACHCSATGCSDPPSPSKRRFLDVPVGPGSNEPAAPAVTASMLSISQIVGVPSLPCQRISDWALPLKSMHVTVGQHRARHRCLDEGLARRTPPSAIAYAMRPSVSTAAWGTSKKSRQQPWTRRRSWAGRIEALRVDESGRLASSEVT